jgi:WD40 repeat protein
VSGTLGAFYSSTPSLAVDVSPLLVRVADQRSAMVAVGYGVPTRSMWRTGSPSRVSSGIRQVRPDVVDIAWSRDDSMLASTGLDSKVWIWDGQTFGEPLILVAIRCKCGRD